jgi:hypothetical protein
MTSDDQHGAGRDDVAYLREPASRGDWRWLHLLNALLFVGLWTFTIVAYQSLPDLVPGHVGTGGVTRWERRESGMWFVVPIMGTFSALLMYLLSTTADHGAAGINVPYKKRLLALPRDAQRYAMQPLRGFMYGMATWLLVLIWWVQYGLYRIAIAADAGVPYAGGMTTGTLLLTALPLLGTVWLARVIRRRITEWEAHQSRQG